MTGPIPVPREVASTDGVTLRLHDLGGDGPILLLCHATGFCGPMWGPVAEVLSDRFRCIALDFRAHGASSSPDRPLTWDGMADDIIAVVEAVSPDGPVPAVGHSMGATALALAEAARPGTIARAWTFEPILFDRTPDIVGPQPSPISEGARRRRATFPSRRAAAERFRTRPPLRALDERVLRLYVEHGFEELPDGAVTLRCRPEDEAGVFEHHHTEAGAAVGRIGIPFLVAIGGDGQRPAETARALAAADPRLRLVVYDDLTHFGPLEAPERLAADMLAWLTDGG